MRDLGLSYIDHNNQTITLSVFPCNTNRIGSFQIETRLSLGIGSVTIKTASVESFVIQKCPNPHLPLQY